MNEYKNPGDGLCCAFWQLGKEPVLSHIFKHFVSRRLSQKHTIFPIFFIQAMKNEKKRIVSLR